MLARLLFFISALSLLFIAAPAAHGGAPAQRDLSGIESVTFLNVSPYPATAGSTINISWDAEIEDSGPVTFNVYIPSDWYSQANWQAGTGVTQTAGSEHSYTAAACPSVTINSVPMHCASYSLTDTGTTTESMTLSFTLRSTATPGASRPVRVTNPQGSAGTPNIGTFYMKVDPVPDVRYVANDVASCGAHSPCDHGPDAMNDAVQALPASGGTIRVVGVHETRGVVVSGKDVTFEPAGAAATIASSNTGSGCHTTFDSLIEVQDGAAVTIRNLTLIGETDSDCGDYGVRIGCDSCSSNLWVEGSTFSDFPIYGIVTTVGASGTIQNSRFLENQHGISVGNASNFTIRGNQFENNLVYGVLQLAANSTLAMYANNFSGNNTGNFQAAVRHLSAAAKNWWGSYSDPLVGPHLTGDYNSYTEGWNHRLGAPVKEWAAGEDNVVLGDAALNGSGRGVIINLGRDAANPPFGVGIAPHVEQLCSDYYDFYALDNPNSWTASLPIDSSTACDDNVRYPEVAYMIEPGSYDTDCTAADDLACWDPIPESKLLLSGANLLISGIDFGYTHIVAGDEEGLDPTAVGQLQMQSTSAPSDSPTLAIVLLSVVLLLAASTLWVRRQQS